ncbi:MAG: carboxypeptidase-like regulatory domain-containing protein [Planctomycetota bacterium]
MERRYKLWIHAGGLCLDEYLTLEGDRQPLPGLTDLGVIECRKAVSLAGIVQDRDGRPMEGATVRGSRGTTATSQADGRFSMGGVSPGQVQVYAYKPGFLRSPAQEVKWNGEGEQPELLPFVLEPASMILGRVTDIQGVPVAGVQVWIADRCGLKSIDGPNVSTGDAGEFAVSLLGGNLDTLVAWHPDYRIYCQEFDRLQPPSEVMIDLERYEVHRFRLLDKSTGNPIPRFSVRVLHDGANRKSSDLAWMPGVYEVLENAEGLFSIPAAAGEDAFEVRAAGFQTVLQDVGESSAEPLIVAMDPGWTLTGRVLMNGQIPKAVAGTLVSKDSETKEVGSGMTSNRIYLRLPGGVTRKFDLDAEGRFEVSGLQAEVYTLTLSVPGRNSHRAEVHNKAPDLGTIELSAGGVIRGLVTAPAEIDRTKVTVRAAGLHTQVAEDGSFELTGVKEGDWPILVSLSGVQLKPFAWPSMNGLPRNPMPGSAKQEQPIAHIEPGGIAEITIDLADLLPDVTHPLRLKLWVGDELYDEGSVSIGSMEYRHGGIKRAPGVFDFELKENVEYSILVLPHQAIYPIETLRVPAKWSCTCAPAAYGSTGHRRWPHPAMRWFRRAWIGSSRPKRGG